ncbi:MAG: hypothetical protein ACLQDA_17610 [Terracidiphilus sp.]
MKKPKNISEQDRAFLDQIDALIGDPEPSPKELAAELEQLGLDPDELRNVAFQRIRSFATQKYSSKGKDLPVRLSEALKQLRPPTPEEQEASRAERAKSRVQGILATVKNVGTATFAAPGNFAPAYRNKEEETSESDKKLLEDQQKQLDGEGEQ